MFVWAGCGDRSTSQPSREQVTQQASSPTVPVFRYQRAFEEAAPEGLAAKPVIEVASGNRGRAWFVVAVHRAGEDPALRLELWTFSQRNQEQLLRPEGAPALFLTLGSDVPKAALDRVATLRKQMATPGTEVTRPRGLPAQGPTQALENLVEACKVVSRAAAKDGDRVDALATVIAGIDDRLILERLQLSTVVRELSTLPQTVYQQQAKGTRRMVLEVGTGEAHRRHEWTRTRTGWVLTGYEIPKDGR